MEAFFKDVAARVAERLRGIAGRQNIALIEVLWGESKKIEFRTECFNALTKTNFSPPAGDISKGTFGTVTSTLAARQVQFALKLMF